MDEDAVTDIFKGIRVLELAGWLFAPTAGAALADWGAEVIKIENPAGGDNYRGLALPGSTGAVNYAMEQVNRNKKSLAIDLKTEGGRDVLLRLVAGADVVITNYLPPVLDRLGLSVDTLRALNPRLIVARATGQGVRGDGATKPAYDATAFWARGAVQDVIAPEAIPEPVPQRGGLGDRYGGTHLAFGIAAALFRRERTGKGSTVDVSLLGTALFMIASDVLSAMQGAFRKSQELGLPRTQLPNPLATNYRSGDGRWFMLCCMQSDRYWEDVCRIIGKPSLAGDERFRDAAARSAHSGALVVELETAFGALPLEHLRAQFDAANIPWAPFQRPDELAHDPQVVANGYLAEVCREGEAPFRLLAGAVQFDEQPATLRPCPGLGENTDDLLLELGFDWEEIIELKVQGSVL